ncbi:AtuA-related protein [Achromobacter aloeverae]
MNASAPTPAPGAATVAVRLYDIAHGRTGDKGDRCNISVIAYRPEYYDILVEQVTPEAVRAVYAHRQPGTITRHLLPRLYAMNFVIDHVLDGGVNDSLNLDSHGKSLAGFLLDLPIALPAHLAPQAAQDRTRQE